MRDHALLGLLLLALGTTSATAQDTARSGNVFVSPGEGSHSGPAVAADVHGGVFVAWRHQYGFTSRSYDLRVRRLLPGGRLDPRWPSDGVNVQPAMFSRGAHAAASTADGDVVVVWEDERDHATSGRDLYAHRVHADGRIAWDSPLLVATLAGDETLVAVLSDGSDGTLVVFTSRIPFGEGIRDLLRTQHVSADGALLSGADGEPIGNESLGLHACHASGDGAGGAYVLDEFASQDPDVPGGTRLHRVHADGSTPWGPDGVAMPGFITGTWPGCITAGSDGSALFAWGSSNDVRMQRFTPAGEIAAGWDSAGTLVAATAYGPSWISLATAPDGGATVVWTQLEFRVPDQWFEYPLYAQRVDGAGHTSWQPGGVLVRHPPSLYMWSPRAFPDAADGSVIVWGETDSVTWGMTIRALDLTATGVPAPGWPVDGADLSETGQSKFTLTACSAGATALECVWGDYTTATGHGDVYAQRVPLALLDEEATGSTPLEIVRPHDLSVRTRGHHGAWRFDVTLPIPATVRCDILDVRGRVVRELGHAVLAAGTSRLTWDGADAKGRAASAGVYIVRVESGVARRGARFILRR